MSFRYSNFGTLFIMAFLKAFFTHGHMDIQEFVIEVFKLVFSHQQLKFLKL